jgi:hypothetical protein
MDCLGDSEELVGAADDLPVGLQAEVIQERDQGRKDLGDATAESGGVEMQDARAAQRLREALDLLDGGVADDGAIVDQRLGGDRNGGEHRRRFS